MATANGDGSTPSIVPRNLSALFDPDHVQERFEDDRRPITRDLAEDAVAAGDVEPNAIDRDGKTWRYRYHVDGCDVVVAVADADEPYRDFVVLTAYVDVVDAGTAWSSGEWSHRELHTAGLLQHLNDAGVTVHDAGFDPETIHVTDPVDYYEHAVVLKRGYTKAICVICGHKTKHGDDFRNTQCR